MTPMMERTGWKMRLGVLLNEGGPWGRKGGGGSSSGGSGGGSGGGGGDDSGGGGGPRNPWSQPPGGGKPRGPRGNSALDELINNLRARFGGNFPAGGNNGTMIRNALIAAGFLWIVLTCFWQIGPQQEGVITRFGKYAGKLGPGIGLTLPSPIDHVQKVDIQAINKFDIPDAAGENLILTGDQNIVDLGYSVRWGVRRSELFLFQLAKPEDTIKEVVESAMREVMSQTSVKDALGPGRGTIEQRVAERAQQVLDHYRAGVSIRGVAISRAVPPAPVVEAFNMVTVKQQEKQANINNANTYFQQVTAKASGEATAFDKVYEQYRLAPGVTRRRMYYDTMEAVLANSDKTIVEPNSIAPYLPLGSNKPRVSVEGAAK